jgi:carboxylate-amine ligase
LDHAFGTSPAFTLGIEEELLLVDPPGFGLSHTSGELLERLGEPPQSARHDIYLAQVELSSTVSRDAGEAVPQLHRLRGKVAEAGWHLMGAGMHPSAPLGDVKLTPAERYQLGEQAIRGLLHRAPECALHVHVGMPDPEAAVHVANALREELPLLYALSGNSPFWHGVDSGFASARWAVRNGWPRVGPPPFFRDFDDWQDTVDAVTAAGELPDYTWLWWEERLHPKLGTVEVRAMDAQSSLDAVAGIAALIHGLAAAAADAAPLSSGTAPAVLAESCFRAVRDGLDARVWRDGELRPVPELAEAAIRRAEPRARELGSGDALGEVRRILQEGTGADHRRAAHARGGMDELLSDLVAETAAG